PGALTEMDRYPALQVRQRERRLPVAAVHRAEQREQRLVLRDRQELAVTERPALRRERPGEDADLAEVREVETAGRLRFHARGATEQRSARESRRESREEVPARERTSGHRTHDGKFPSTAMMKLTPRYGWRLLCGCVPPVAATAPAARFVFVLAAYTGCPA